MASEKIVPPFRMDDYTDIYIIDANGTVLAMVEPNMEKEIAFARELRDVMNENASRLCHAANGEGEARVWCVRDPSRKCVDCELCGDKASNTNQN